MKGQIILLVFSIICGVDMVLNCECSEQGSITNRCNPTTGQCQCRQGFKGMNCNECVMSSASFPDCLLSVKCNCDKVGSLSNSCHPSTKQCLCRQGFRGRICNECAVSNASFPDCQSSIKCKCSKDGSINNICNPLTGQCQCRQGFKGKTCDECVISSMSYPKCYSSDKCKCNIDGTLISYEKYGPCTVDSCMCKEYVTGNDCSKCKNTYFNLTKNIYGGCSKCGCLSAGTIGNIKLCDETGQCLCRPFVTGRTCNKCKPGYRSLDRRNYFSCTSCNCNVGGSVSKTCSENGHCKCKPNVEGAHCDKLKTGDFYILSYFHNIFEIEDADTLDGSKLQFQYSDDEFVNFTGKGYVELGKEKLHAIRLHIVVPVSKEYQILVQYKLNYTESAILFIDITRKENPMSYGATANFHSSTEPTFASLWNSNQTKIFFLTAGTWVIDMDFSFFKTVLVDYLVIIPEDYYTGGDMQPDAVLPCSIKMHLSKECMLYKYIDLELQHFQAENGYVKKIGNTNLSKTETLNDSSTLFHLISMGDMAVISRKQITLTMNIAVQKADEYFLVVTYFNTDEHTHFVDVYEDDTGFRGYLEAVPCSYIFLCRLVVLNADGYPVTLKLLANKSVEITFLGNLRGNIAIDFVTLIPKAVWSVEYIVPTEYCYMKERKCLDKVAFKNLKNSITIQPTGKSNQSFPFHLIEKVNFFGSAILGQDVETYFFIFQYSQKFSTFKVTITIIDNSNNLFVFNTNVHSCLSIAGCRGFVAVGNLSGVIDLKISIPDGKEIWISSMFFVHESYFDDDLLVLKRTEFKEKFEKLCVDSNNIPHIQPQTPFCADAQFTLTTEFTGKTYRCECDKLGSKFSSCNKIGGQCACKEGVVGRTCNKCKKGFYGFPRCQPCNCFILGSLNAECDRFGYCKCHQNFSGAKCDECKVGYWGFPSCKDCSCDERSSYTSACRSYDGQCPCIPNFDGQQCEKCQVGFYSFPECKSCNCHAAGLLVSDANPSGCHDNDPDLCTCKKNVEGDDCGSCKDYYFNMTLGNPEGCQKCNCSSFGTIRGSESCDKTTGQCICQPNVEGRSCDKCIDGWKESNATSIFSCEPCLCSNSGSVNQVCDKKTGQCICKKYFYGLKCNQPVPGFYLPTLDHIKINGSKIVPVAKWINNGIVEGIKVNGSYATNVQQIHITKSGFYYLLIHYSLQKNQIAQIDFEISNKVRSFSATHNLSTSAYLQPQIDIIKKRKKYLKLNLTKGVWKLKMIFYDTIILKQITLVPHLSNSSIQSHYNPCSINDNQSFCALYTYMDIFKDNIIIIDRENNNLEFTLMNYQNSSAFNKTVFLQDTLNISSVAREMKEFYVVIQYLSFVRLTEVELLVGNEEETEIGHFLLPECRYKFACRQVALNKITKHRFKGGYLKRNLHFKVLSGGPIYIKFISLVPVQYWSTNFIRPSLYCIHYSSKCINASFLVPAKSFELMPKLSNNLTLGLPPNVNSYAILLSNEQRSLRWAMKLSQNFYYIVLHYYQPNLDGFYAKVVVSTDRRAIASRVYFSYCPSMYGCRTTLYYFQEDFIEPFYLSGNHFRLTFTFHGVASVWLDRVLCIQTSEYVKNQNVLKIDPFDISIRYLQTCVGLKYISDLNIEFCKAFTFELTVGMGTFPKPCACCRNGKISLLDCTGDCFTYEGEIYENAFTCSNTENNSTLIIV
nr:laminin subunit alpha [Hydra vulgaris]